MHRRLCVRHLETFFLTNTRMCERHSKAGVFKYTDLGERFNVQSTAHHTIHFRLCTALISRALALLSNCKCCLSFSRLLLRPLKIGTNPHWAHVVSYRPLSLCVIHKKGLCPSSGDINRLNMMMMMKINSCYSFYSGHHTRHCIAICIM
jgi:hypothetical protein